MSALLNCYRDQASRQLLRVIFQKFDKAGLLKKTVQKFRKLQVTALHPAFQFSFAGKQLLIMHPSSRGRTTVTFARDLENIWGNYVTFYYWA